MTDYERRKERYHQLMRELLVEHRLSPLSSNELLIRMHRIFQVAFPAKPRLVVNNDAVKKG